MPIYEAHREARNDIINTLRADLNPRYTYHCLAHTLDVVYWSGIIGKEEGLSDDEIQTVLTAAAFHDSGFLNSPDNHEEESCKIFLSSIKDLNFSEEERKNICQLILSTKLPQAPFDKTSMCLCDADLAYLGDRKYDETAALLQKEIINIKGELSEKDWIEIQIDFLENHRFHTQFARNVFQTGKLKAMEGLLRKRVKFQ